jgi:hypothetical protein
MAKSHARRTGKKPTNQRRTGKKSSNQPRTSFAHHPEATAD